MGALLLVLLNDAGTPLAAGQLAVTVSNAGDAPVDVGVADITGSTAAFTIVSDAVSSTTLAPGEGRRIVIGSVTATAGTFAATLRIPSSDPDGVLTVDLSLTITGALVKAIAVDPLTWDFGSVDTATGTATKVFTVSSTGTAPVIMGTVAIGGAGASSYAKSADGISGVTIPAGESRTVLVTFDPATDGAKAGTLTFPSDAGASIVATLTGTGTTGAPAPAPSLVTRFYLSRQASDVSSIAESGNWNIGAAATAEDFYALTAARGGPAVAWGLTVPHGGTSGGRSRLARWIGPPMAAQTLTDIAFSCYATGYRASALGSSVTSALQFGIRRDADSSIDWQGILAMGSAGASAWPLSSNPLPRRFPRGDPFSWTVSLDFLDGDRLILELGFRAFSTSTNGARIRYGGASTDSDLESTQDAQDISLAPWISFASGLLVLP